MNIVAWLVGLVATLVLLAYLLWPRARRRKAPVGSAAAVPTTAPNDDTRKARSARADSSAPGHSAASIAASPEHATPAAEAQPGARSQPAARAPHDESKALSEPLVFRKLYELALGSRLAADVAPKYAQTAASVANTVEAAATEPRYAPRRPQLLPQLIRALNDPKVSRRELADIIARDPTLVGGLLKLANSPYYRVSEQPVESIDRALAVLGMKGVRYLIAAATVQPVFRLSGGLAKFPETIWAFSYRAGAAAEVHAADGEEAELFAAQLLGLVTGLASIVVFRVATDLFRRAKLDPDATAIAFVLDAQTAVVARTIAGSWELSPRLLEALDEQANNVAQPRSALGRSLHFGLVAGALSVLEGSGAIGEREALATLVAAGGVGPRFDEMWARFKRERLNEV